MTDMSYADASPDASPDASLDASTDDSTAAGQRRARLAEWERRTAPYIIVSAILPLVGSVSGPNDSPVRIALSIVCWLVFVADLVVHVRLADRYLRTRSGKVDLSIVILTAPYYLFLGNGGSVLITLARLARVARLARGMGRSKRLRTLMEQLSQVVIYAVGLLVACSLVVKWVEPASSGFATYGDAFWWGAVTLTTVGYGDYYPVTAAGRLSAVILMVGGVAFLGTLAGTLGAFFGLGGDSAKASTTDAEPQPSDASEALLTEPAITAPGLTTPGLTTPAVDSMTASSDPVAYELALLRAQVSELVARLDVAGARES